MSVLCSTGLLRTFPKALRKPFHEDVKPTTMFSFSSQDNRSWASQLTDLRFEEGPKPSRKEREEMCQVGNEIGIKVDAEGSLFFLVNGRCSLPFSSSIPAAQPLWAVVDVYGRTQQVTFLGYFGGEPDTLQNICLGRVVDCLFKLDDVQKLPLPLSIRSKVTKHLQFKLQL